MVISEAPGSVAKSDNKYGNKIKEITATLLKKKFLRMCSAFYQLLGFIVKKRFFINIDFHMIVIKKCLFGINNDSFSYATFR